MQLDSRPILQARRQIQPAKRVKVQLMGGFSLLVDGTPVEACLHSTLMGKALLCYLVLARGRYLLCVCRGGRRQHGRRRG